MSQNIDRTLGYIEEARHLKDIETLSSIKGSGVEPIFNSRKSNRRSLQIVDLQVLCLLQMKAMSGYELKKNLSGTFGYEISFGTLYPHLRALESAKLIFGKWVSKKPRKRIYSLTDRGREALRSNALRLSRLLQLIFDSTTQK